MFRSTMFLAASLLITHFGLPSGSVGQDSLPSHDGGLTVAAEPDPPDALFHDYLYSGRLPQASIALSAAIKVNPEDDESRFCLGIVQFGLAIEHFVQDLNRHGFLTERTFGPVISRELRQLFPDQADSEPFSNAVFRDMVQNWIADVNRAEETLAGIKQTSVKLHIRPALIKLDPVGQGNAVNAAELLHVMFPQEQNDQIKQFGLTLDRGDVHWLRGYLHIQAALGEGLLAHDFQSLVETCAHQLFEKVDSPHKWLLNERRKRELVETPYGYEYLEPPTTVYLDAVAFFGQCLDLPVIEPQRFEAVLSHLEKAVENAREMWTYIVAETDDDDEWIPNPRQRGSIAVEVTQPMIDTWLDTLLETQRILRGEKLVPFWRDLLQKRPRELVRGMNIRKVFEEPPGRTSIILWVQGTAAVPYLEEGELTEFANDEFVERIDEVFGPAFPGFALWFN